MTRNEFYEKYGDVIVKFSSYYKYTFYYSATLPDGSTISVGYGGNSDDIYRFEVANNEEVSVNSLYPFEGTVYKDGERIEGFFDY